MEVSRLKFSCVVRSTSSADNFLKKVLNMSHFNNIISFSHFSQNFIEWFKHLLNFINTIDKLEIYEMFLSEKNLEKLCNPDTKIFGDLTIFTNHFKQPKLVWICMIPTKIAVLEVKNRMEWVRILLTTCCETVFK